MLSETSKLTPPTPAAETSQDGPEDAPDARAIPVATQPQVVASLERGRIASAEHDQHVVGNERNGHQRQRPERHSSTSNAVANDRVPRVCQRRDANTMAGQRASGCRPHPIRLQP